MESDEVDKSTATLGPCKALQFSSDFNLTLSARELSIFVMKQRITYLLPEGDRVESSSIKVENDSLHFARAKEAAQEWRLTLGWEELPGEVC